MEFRNRDANLRMMLQSRGPGQYGYVIGRPDLEEWGEPSLETFELLAEADDAGREAMKIAAHQRMLRLSELPGHCQ